MFKIIDVETLIIFSSFISFVFIIWFNTNAFVEYAKLLGCTKLFFIEEYEEFIKDNCVSDYLSFLGTRKDSFLTRIITCPFCLGVWYSLFISLVIGVVYFCLIYLLSLILYFGTVRLSHMKHD